MQNKFKIKFYIKENDNVPFLDFYQSQDYKMKARMNRLLALLESKGNLITYPYSKKLDKDIFELRVIQGNNHCRILYFFFVDKQIIITNGFIEKSNRTPYEELLKANNYRNDWIRRNK